ncbi:MAG: hypothetical protein AAF623_13585 [Planctomycetota bacterium]
MLSRYAAPIALFLVCSILGCAGVKDTMRLSEKDSLWNPVEKLKTKKLAKSMSSEEEPNPPVTMTILWKESVFQKPGKPAVRGFGGRVFFYDEFNNTVPAKGKLVIYGFDESNEAEKSQAADKKFEFTSEDLESLFGDTGLGPSYSIWCPWDQVGGFRKTIALIPMFKTEDKKVIRSGQSINVLQGKVDEHAESSDDRPYKVLGSSPAVVRRASYQSNRGRSRSSVSQVAYTEPTAEKEPAKKPGIKTSTIRMAPSLSNHLGRLNNTQPSKPRLPGAASYETGVSTKSKPAERKKSRAKAWIDGLRAQTEISDDSEKSAESSGSDARVFGSPGSLN